ncbi:MAG: class D sortase [Clostridia bacterium]|jgi:LPXTG-site transpeptidase (sortase) family protein|nr:class D sortase [Clostridia bacterium]HCF65316.1 hypothetical protein [Clostridiales bacterium]HJJ09515.1 class D sortase [Clostridiaceae bacterium]
MVYTKRGIFVLSLVLTVIIYLSINLLIYNLQQQFKNINKSNQVISIKIPANSQEKIKKMVAQTLKKEQEIPKIEPAIQDDKVNEWRIKIPAINVDAEICEGVTNNVIAKHVGHFCESSKWNGNVALAAHNRGYNCNFFQNIKKLSKGDIVIYSTQNGIRRYKVEINKIIDETDWSYVHNTEDNRITLITCEENKKEYRRCIQAIEI